MRIEIDDYHYHEVIDRIWMLVDMLDEYVVTHPVILIDKKSGGRLDKVLQDLLSINGSICRKRDMYETHLNSGGKRVILNDRIVNSSNVKPKRIEVNKDVKKTKTKSKVKVDDVGNKKKD